jgi:hypothetical protein
MKKYYIYITAVCLTVLCSPNLDAQTNLDFMQFQGTGYSIFNSYNSVHPWYDLYGTPDLADKNINFGFLFPNPTQVAFQRCIGLGAGRATEGNILCVNGGNVSGSYNDNKGGEGCFFRFNFLKHKPYKISGYMYNRPGNDVNGMVKADYSAIKLINNLNDQYSPSNCYHHTPPNGMTTNNEYEIVKKENYANENWEYFSKNFLSHESNYYNLFVESYDKGVNNSGSSPFFYVGGLNISCSPENIDYYTQMKFTHYDGSNNAQYQRIPLPIRTFANNQIKAQNGVNVLENEVVNFYAGKSVLLLRDFEVKSGAIFNAEIKNNNCENEGGYCSRFQTMSFDNCNSTSAQPCIFIPNAFIPYSQYKQRRTWKPISSLYNLPFNCYKIKCEIYNRWGIRVFHYEEENWENGINPDNLYWNGQLDNTGDCMLTLNDPVFVYYIEFTNCDGTFLREGDITALSSCNPNGLVQPDNEIYITDFSLLNTNMRVTTNPLAQLTLHPNPASNNITISSTVAIQSLSIQTMDGKTIQVIDTKALNDIGNMQVNISTLSNGLYLVIAHSQNGIFTQKLIKN